MISTTAGSARADQFTKFRLGPSGNRASSAPIAIRFGGVPTGVAIPPTDAPYATPSRTATANALPSSPARSAIASAIGIMIRVVAVLEIHIDSTARRDREAQHESARRGPDHEQHMQRNAPVHAGALDRKGEQESAEKQQNERRRVGRGNNPGRRDIQERKRSGGE